MRRAQYSLKTLFLLVTIAALLLLWYRDHVRLARLEEEIVPMLEQSLGQQEQEVKLLDQKLATAVRKFRPPQFGMGVIPTRGRFVLTQDGWVLPYDAPASSARAGAASSGASSSE